MGKGDRKTRRGKIIKGTYGNVRLNKKNKKRINTIKIKIKKNRKKKINNSNS